MIDQKKFDIKCETNSQFHQRSTYSSTPIAPKSETIQSSCQYLFTLLGSTGAKAARRMLMKLTHKRKKSCHFHSHRIALSIYYLKLFALKRPK